MSTIIEIPFTLGQSEKVDAKLLPQGLFRRAENVRMRQDGRVGKRYGAPAYSTSVTLGSFTGNVALLASWQGNRLVAGGNKLFLDTADGWYSRGEISVFSPVRVSGVARQESSADKLAHPTVAYAGGFWFYAWDDDTVVYVLITTDEGAAVVNNSVHAGKKPRWVVTGSTVRLVYQDGTDIRTTSWDSTTLQQGSDTTVSAITRGDADHEWDAAAFDSTRWLFFGQRASDLEVHIITNATVNSTANIAEGIGGGTPDVYCSVIGTVGEKIYVAYVRVSTGAVKVKTYNDALGGASATTTVQTRAENTDQPGLVRESSTSALLCWGGGYLNPDGQGGKLNYCSISSSAVAGTITTTYNFRPASRPFIASGLIHVLASTDNRPLVEDEDGWGNQRTYWLVNLNSLPKPEMNCWPVRSYPYLAAPIDRLYDVVSSGSLWSTAVRHELRQDHFGTNDTATIGIDSIQFTDNTMGLAAQHRETVEVDGAVHITGGYVAEYMGGTFTVPNGFAPYAPAIVDATVGAGGSVDTGVHVYRVVAETIDRLGRRHRSGASDPVTVTTTTGNNQVTLTISTLGLGSPFDVDGTVQTVYHVYRSTVGGTFLHRITPGQGAPDPYPTAPRIQYVDTQADADIDDGELIYTDGGVQPNMTAPACRFARVIGTRVWLGGLLYADRSIASKLLVAGEPVQFTNHEAFQVVWPGELTGLAGLDGATVGFTLEGAYVVYGDGPDDRGQGAFTDPRRIPASVGCIDSRSIVETPLGIIFQSQRGMYLLPRGFGPPVFIGEHVQATLAQYPVVIGAVRVSEAASSSSSLGEDTVRFAVVDSDTAPTAGRLLVYDLRTEQWYVDTLPVAPACVGLWDGLFVYARRALSDSSPIRLEGLGTFADAGAFFSSVLETGDIRPFGLNGRGMVRGVVLLGEYRAACTVTVEMSLDSGKTFPYSGAFTLSGLTAGDRLALRWNLPVRYLSELRLRISDSHGSSSEGCVWHGLTLDEVDRLPGSRNVSASYRVS